MRFETTIFERGDIRITDQQVVFGDQSILLDEITMVDVQRIGPKPTGGIGLLMILIVGLVWIFDVIYKTDYVIYAIPVALGGFLILALLMMKETFSVWVITEERVAEVYISSIQARTRDVADALNAAVARDQNRDGKVQVG